ncbi:TIGR02281 family clan AA aspartic protease [Maricaulis sp.]|uniref:retropepsin-like aspartic protease family protein n=1 Tax=Maricaulis sp. TaxID=1486257 RepID=UPI0025BF5AC6|nr:TIGR02281 family clan AA aspartic protease [Maricaulis sp.]
MRQLITRAALPVLALAIALIVLRVISWPLWEGVEPLARTVFMTTILILLGLALTGSALAPDRTRHRNLIAWVSISAAACSVAVLDRDYADWQYQDIWGAAPVEAASARRSPGGVQLDDGAIVLARQFDGHFYIDTEINGTEVNFLIDTGATGVALTLDDARRVGIRTDRLEFSIQTSTAAGRSMAAAVEIRTLDLPGRTFERVPALVMSGGERSLLGMTVLERFDVIEIRRDQLVLRSE